MDQNGFIYFIECQGHVKIGFARNVAKRIADLQTACPFPLKLLAKIAGNLWEERDYHARFEIHRRQGEWFILDGSLAQYIASLSK